MPNKEANLYKELLCEHHVVFSKSKADHGCATNFEHKIELNDDVPVVIVKISQCRKLTENFWMKRSKTG